MLLTTCPVPFEGLARLTALPSGDLLASGTSSLSGAERVFAVLRARELRWDGPLVLPGRRLDLQHAPVCTDAGVFVPGFLPDPGVLVRWDPLEVEDLPLAPRPRELVAVVSLGSAVLVCGGRYASGRRTKLVERYDPATRRWRRDRALPSARTWAHGARASSGRVVVCGGDTRDADSAFAVDLYDPATGRWTRTTPRWPAPSSNAPGRPVWVAPLALSGGNVLLTLERRVGEALEYPGFFAVLDPVSAQWSDPIPQLRGRILFPPFSGVALAGDWVARLSQTAEGERFVLWSVDRGEWRDGPHIRSQSSGRQLARLRDGRVALADGETLALFDPDELLD
jgi:hypothetical protein